MNAVSLGREHGFRLLVFTVLGRSFMGLKAECPFLAADALLARHAGRFDGALVEIHAEATSEKMGMGHWCDGMASLKTCPHDASQHVSLSGTKVREMLTNGEIPPIEFTRPEVAQVLIEGFRQTAASAKA